MNDPSPSSLADTQPSAAAIRLRDVTKVFEGSSGAAVDDLSLDIERGTIMALLGPSGCGKTTTLRMINRLIEPTAGTIEIDGTDVMSQSAQELRRGIGYVIQQVGLFPHRTIASNIATVPTMLGWDKSDTAARVEELTTLVGLDHELLDRYPDELSGGQQQRVGVARALAADPPVLLMDEPFGAVDPIVRARLQNELLDLQTKVSKTIVLVTHDVDEALRVADRIALMSDFVTLEFGPLLGEALASNEVDAVIWNSTAPQITEQGFKVLEEYGDQLAAAINELSAMITTDDLLAWNTQTDIEFRESDEVATEWLESKGLL